MCSAATHLQLVASKAAAARSPTGARASRTRRRRSRSTRRAELAHLHALVDIVQHIHVVAVKFKVKELGICFNTVLGERLGQNNVCLLYTSPSPRD